MRVAIVRFFAVLLAVLTVAGGHWPTTAVASQRPPGVIDAFSYESPTYGYSVTWGDIWTVAPEQTGSSDGFDALTLDSTLVARVQIFGVSPNLDPSRVVAAVVDNATNSVPNVEVIAEEVRGSAPSATLEYVVSGVTSRRLIESRMLESGDAIVAVSLEAPVDVFDLNLRVTQGDIVVDGGPLFASLASEPSDDPEPAPNDRSGRDGDDDDETGRSKHDVGDDGNGKAPTRRPPAGTVYESPSYGYTITYDPDEWELLASVAGTADNPYDRAFFSNGPSLIAVIGRPDYDADELAACVDDRFDVFESIEGVSNVEALNGRRAEGENNDRAWATYTYVFTSDDGEETDEVRYLECRWLGHDVAVVIDHVAPEDEYDAESEAREDFLRSLTSAKPQG